MASQRPHYNIPTTMRLLTSLASFFLLLQNLAIAATDALPDYENAYRHDRLWPSHVRLSEDLLNEDGRRLAGKGIPLVMIRAYADGKLALVDRAGTFLVDHAKTDFLARIADFQEKNPEAGDAANFLHQIGRRVFDLSYDSSKAVPESELVRFETFLICHTSSEKSELKALIAKLDDLQPQLQSDMIEPILVFEEFMPNQEFYDHLEALEISHPVVVPIFQRGFLEAIFTEREADMNFLLINKNGKLIRAEKTPSAALGISSDDA